ncbi:GTP cyclohydrolase [Leucothrix pacifica]|uniref:GTP cyclohydrolase-2 n=2 Tax=Leucothrix pacifica TaxID=1247513 RepID=A0A317C161_9GAMM|nr:GTP cyclohydrolase [Leucothrix pacifica]
MPSAARVRNNVVIPLHKLEGTDATFFTFDGLVDGKEHIAIGLGDFDKVEVPLVRLHSECLTGDVFESQRCDCGAQLEEAIKKVKEQGGYILYLRQEGRGIGLYNKIDAYALQLEGYDTFEANQKLGFADDLRDFEVAAQMLHTLKADRIRLLTNNPNKVQQLEQYKIDVTETVTTGAFISAGNHSYLKAKVLKANHQIDVTSDDAS